jgi:hypothetical protein
VTDKAGRVDISFNAIGIPNPKIRVPLGFQSMPPDKRMQLAGAPPPQIPLGRCGGVQL